MCLIISVSCGLGYFFLYSAWRKGGWCKKLTDHEFRVSFGQGFGHKADGFQMLHNGMQQLGLVTGSIQTNIHHQYDYSLFVS